MRVFIVEIGNAWDFREKMYVFMNLEDAKTFLEKKKFILQGHKKHGRYYTKETVRGEKWGAITEKKVRRR